MAIKLSKIINSWVPENSKVIDFGCGDGSLLKELMIEKNVFGYGVEINDIKIKNPKPISTEPIGPISGIVFEVTIFSTIEFVNWELFGL